MEGAGDSTSRKKSSASRLSEKFTDFEFGNTFYTSDSLFKKHKLTWTADQDTIIIITKAYDNKLVCYTRQLAEWLLATPRFGKQHPFTVFVDGHLETAPSFGYQEILKKYPGAADRLKFWTPKLCFANPEQFHLMLLLGGDGTVLFTSWMFQKFVAPIIPFHLGSLGFLTPFPFKKYREDLDSLFSGNPHRVTLRMRLSCTIYRYRKDPLCCDAQAVRQCPITGALWQQKRSAMESGVKADGDVRVCRWELLETDHKCHETREHAPVDKQEEESVERYGRDIPLYTTVPDGTFEVLNELVVDRGPCSYMSKLELFGDENHLTTVQADGLVIGTPTGSTAYSLSASGSLCHPCVPCFLVTPICAHTLNFRPMLVPHTMTMRVVVPFHSRASAFCSFDGRNRVELRRGDHVKVSFSHYPVPTVTKNDTSKDWFESLQQCLMWNKRVRQKSFVVIESNDHDRDSKHADNNEDQSDKEDSVIACVNKRNTSTPPSRASTPFSEIEEESTPELVPWTDEEMQGGLMGQSKGPGQSPNLSSSSPNLCE